MGSIVRDVRSRTSTSRSPAGLVATLAELRTIGTRPPLSLTLNNWPKMYRSASLEPGHVDYLYSELECVPWSRAAFVPRVRRNASDRIARAASSGGAPT